jgi:hypothetical protein
MRATRHNRKACVDVLPQGPGISSSEDIAGGAGLLMIQPVLVIQQSAVAQALEDRQAFMEVVLQFVQ